MTRERAHFGGEEERGRMALTPCPSPIRSPLSLLAMGEGEHSSPRLKLCFGRDEGGCRDQGALLGPQEMRSHQGNGPSRSKSLRSPEPSPLITQMAH